MKFRSLVLTMIAASCLAIAVQAQSLQKLDLPDEVNSELDGEPADFELTSPETAVIELSLVSDAFDPYLEIQDSNGDTLGQNDDGGEGSNSLMYFIAEADTAYTIRVRSYSDGAEGSYTLTVNAKEAEEISIEQPARTDFESKPQFFTFTGKAGDEVDFAVEAEDFDSILTLMDMYGNTLVSSDDGIGSNPFISDVVIPTDGTYILNLDAYSDDPPEDPIQLIVQPTTIQDLAFGEALTSEHDKSYLRFEAEEGVTYHVEVRATEPANFNVEVKPQTSEYVEISGNSYGTSALSFEFTPTTDGVYKLTVSGISSNYESTTYTTTISEVK